MCKSCERPHPTQDECYKLFYRHRGELYRQALPRSAFGTQSSYVLYNKESNKPSRIYNSQRCVKVIGYGQLPEGAIQVIMDGKQVSEWYHRERVKRNQHGQFVTRNQRRESGEVEDDDEWMDKPIPPRYPKYATIPAKIYKNGFLTLRMRTR